MEAGARGCQVILSGKLTGERHRTERFKSGTIKYCGEAVHLHMDKGFYQARLKPGVIGVNVWIMSPTAKLPDEIKVKGAVAPTRPRRLWRPASARTRPKRRSPGLPPRRRARSPRRRADVTLLRMKEPAGPSR